MLCMLGSHHVPKLQEMAVLVELQVIMVYLSTWNLSLVTVDLPSFLGRFVMFCVLVRHCEQMVWGLSRGVVVYSEWRLPLLIFLSLVCVCVCGGGGGVLALLHVLSLYCDRMFCGILVARIWATLSIVSYLVIILYSCNLHVWRWDVRVCLLRLFFFVELYSVVCWSPWGFLITS